jgi:hypothetical protein
VANRERRKGLEGEREVAAIWRDSGVYVQNLEGLGDHSISGLFGNEQIHCEVKRCETTRPWAWFEQARSEAPVGAVPVVAFRRSRSPWLALIELEDLARLLA